MIVAVREPSRPWRIGGAGATPCQVPLPGGQTGQGTMQWDGMTLDNGQYTVVPGLTYRAVVGVWGLASPSKAVSYAQGKGFTNVRVWTSPHDPTFPADWTSPATPTTSDTLIYVEGTYSGADVAQFPQKDSVILLGGAEVFTAEVLACLPSGAPPPKPPAPNAGNTGGTHPVAVAASVVLAIAAVAGLAFEVWKHHHNAPKRRAA